MNKYVLTILILIISSSCSSQDSDDAVLIPSYGSLDHLKPPSSYGQTYKARVLANSNIENKDEDMVLQFFIYPSFEKISLTSILNNSKDDSYRIAYTTSKKHHHKLKKRHVTSKYRAINKEIVEMTNSIFEDMLIETHYPKGNKNFNGMDGISYQFYVNGNKYGQMYGETWSPKEGTNTHYLVKISEALVQYANGKIDEGNLKDTIKNFKNMMSTSPQLSQYEYLEMYSMCNSNFEIAAPIIAGGSIVISEYAEEKEIEDYQLNAMLIIWRLKACDLLDYQSDFWEPTIEAIGKECRTIIEIGGSNENDYILEANKVLKNHVASIVSLSWATMPSKEKESRHIVIASDSIEEMRVEYKGYGWQDPNTKSSCVKSKQGVLQFNRY
jgi:hypothetical protein